MVDSGWRFVRTRTPATARHRATHTTVQSTAVPRLPEPHTILKSGRATLRFYLGDSLEVMRRLGEGSIDAMVTSPPYNLGIRYRTYDDTIPRGTYLEWTDEWVRLAKRVLSADGSLFLNVGAKPSDPWTALDVAQAVRPHLELQNTIHWIKSIAIEKSLAGARARLDGDLAVGHYKPINSRRFLHDCHEFIFHFSPQGDSPLDRQAVGVRYQDQSNAGRSASATRTSRISTAGRQPRRACAVAATPGSSPTRPSRIARRIGRTPRRFRPSCRRCASSFTAWAASGSSPNRSSDSDPRRSPVPSSA